MTIWKEGYAVLGGWQQIEDGSSLNCIDKMPQSTGVAGNE
jgi:hypothetical protein